MTACSRASGEARRQAPDWGTLQPWELASLGVCGVSEDDSVERLSVTEAAERLGVTRDAIHDSSRHLYRRCVYRRPYGPLDSRDAGPDLVPRRSQPGEQAHHRRAHEQDPAYGGTGFARVATSPRDGHGAAGEGGTSGSGRKPTG